ncbi:MAG: hypothetical protein ACOX87_15530 [Chloroflexota bacterium]|jgi:hypothetical protein
MFEVSDDAKELILSHLESEMEGRPELRRGATRVGLRLNLERSRAYLSLAFPRSTDRVVTFMGRPLLIIDPEDLSRLEQTRLTVRTGPNGDMLSMEPTSQEQAVNMECGR